MICLQFLLCMYDPTRISKLPTYDSIEPCPLDSSLLLLPLYIPVLIFATSAIDAASMGLPYAGQLAILGAMLVGALTLTPLAISAALRVSVN